MNKSTLITLSACLLLVSAGAESQTQTKVQLQLKPSKCVSLRQGQTCYADVTLEWQSNKTGDYCLFTSIQQAPLQCWRGQSQGTFSGELSADHNIRFMLREQEVTLGEAELQMAWVYKKKRSSVSWRVF